MRTSENKYYPIRHWWKFVIPAFIILFLVAALIVTCTTFQNLIQFFPSRGMTYLMTLHAIISLSVCICFFLCIKRLIDVFSLNLEQERNILASLYQEKEKREIINNDEKEINKLKENIRKELKQETEKRKLSNDKTNMNLLTRLFALHFDRSFSGKGWRQLAWLFGVIVTVFLLIYLVSFAFIFPEPSLEEWTGIDKDVPMGRLLQLICLFIDPGNIVEVPPYLRWFSLLVVVLGLILFCGLLISVISNMLERRVERYREGDIVYPLQNHIVIIGFDNMVPTLIQQICDDTHYGNCHILIQSTQPAQEIRSKIHTELDAKNEKRIVVLRARRDSIEELEKLYTTKAREVFLIGERNEHDHDSLNIDCLKKIVDIHKRCNKCSLIPFTVLFEYQTTFAAFQLTDLSAEWRKYIEFHPFNFYEGWAKKILVSRQYGKGENCIEYPPLDREAITYESEKHVHLVIIGMSRMGVAIGVEAAHLLHFPNFCRDKNIKSVITFIDENADREMNFFCGRYRHYFEISSTHYYDMSKDERHERFVLPTRFKGKDADFLDVEFEFIKGRAETPAIQNLIKEWVHDSGQVLTIAVCLNYPPQSMAMGLYLPDDVYDENIPVFVRQETSSALLNMLNSKKKDEAIHKYSHVFPFGMLDNCYDLDKKSRREGQIINYIYDFKNKYGNVPQSCPPDNELKDSWNKLSVSLQWSNLYSAYSISPKLRSIGITDGYVKLDNDQITLLAEVEHNRWNMEKLLLGFRKPTADNLWQQGNGRHLQKETLCASRYTSV